MNRYFTALIAMAFIAAVGGASITQPAQAEQAKKAAKKSTKKAAKKSEQATAPHAALQLTVLNNVAMQSTCNDQALKRGLSGQKRWDYIRACASKGR